MQSVKRFMHMGILGGFLIIIMPCLCGLGGCRDNHDKVLVLDRVTVTQVPPAGLQITFRVLDDDGNIVPELTSDDITVYNNEKNIPFGQGTESGGVSEPGVPIDFGIYTAVALDLSDSIVDAGKLDDVIDGGLTLVNQLVTQPISGLKHHMAIIAFGRPELLQKIQDFTDDGSTLVTSLESLRQSTGRGSTDLYGAYSYTLSEVENQGTNLAFVERFAMIISDGSHEAGDEENLREQAMTAKDASIVNVYALGIDSSVDATTLSELANLRGYYAQTDSSGMTRQLKSMSERIQAIARSNYMIGVCTPVSLGTPSLTISVTVNKLSGGITTTYAVDQLDGDVANCDPDGLLNSPQQ